MLTVLRMTQTCPNLPHKGDVWWRGGPGVFMTWGRGRVVAWGGGGRDQSLSVTLTVTVFSHFSVTFSLTFLRFFRSGSEAGLEPGFARVLKISDLFVFRDGAGRGRLHSVFSGPAGAQL